MRQLQLGLLMLLTSGCVSLPATQPEYGEAGTAGEPGPAPSATSALQMQSRASVAQGNYAQASAAIERALRIEPNNPYLWLELGKIHLASGDRQQAAALAQKALSMAGDDAAAQVAARRLIEQAASQ